MNSSLSLSELNSTLSLPLILFKLSELPLFFAKLRNSELGFSECRPSNSFMDLIFSDISASTIPFSSSSSWQILSLLIKKSPRN